MFYRLFLLRSNPNPDLDVILNLADLKTNFPSATPSTTDNDIHYHRTYWGKTLVEFIGLPPLKDPSLQHLHPIVRWCLEAPFPGDTVCAIPLPDGTLDLHNPLNLFDEDNVHQLAQPYPHAIDSQLHSPLRNARTAIKSCFSASANQENPRLDPILSIYEQTLSPTPSQATSVCILLEKVINTPSTTMEDTFAAFYLAQHGLMHTSAAAALTLWDQAPNTQAQESVKIVAYLIWRLFAGASDLAPWDLAKRVCVSPEQPLATAVIKLGNYLDTQPRLWQHSSSFMIDLSKEAENTQFLKN